MTSSSVKLNTSKICSKSLDWKMGNLMTLQLALLQSLTWIKEFDAAVLQYQNKKIVQQLDIHRHELHDLETKNKEVKDKQTYYDDMLRTVNQLWNQLVDDMVLLGIWAGGGYNVLKTLDHADKSRGSVPTCPVEMFLCKLLGTDFIDSSDDDGITNYVERALSARHSSTRDLIKSQEDTNSSERIKTESMTFSLHGKLSVEDAMMQLSNIDDMMKEEAKILHEMISALHLKHKEYADEIQTYISNHSTDKSEIKRLQGELEEIMAELEESRRKLVELKMQKNIASGMHASTPVVANDSLSPEKPTDKTMGLREIKDLIEETKQIDILNFKMHRNRT